MTSSAMLTLALDGSPAPAGPAAWCGATGAVALALARGPGGGTEVAVVDVDRPQV